jgi:cytoplasmic iron level regulating protein YaaA (DUF328/UPF0246 family)
MLIVISPAKTLDYATPPQTSQFTQPEMLDDAQLLIDRAAQLSALDIAELMKVSIKIADLNFERFRAWQQPFTPDNAKQALLAFKGDVYTGLGATDFSAQDLAFAQTHLRILSGLYGLLRPLDLMQPYRLEMGRSLSNPRGRNLYEFWGDRITEAINRELARAAEPVLLNLASIEYFKAVRPKKLAGRLITPHFKEFNNGSYKVVGVHAKKARGMLSRFIIKNRLTDVDDLKSFSDMGYRFHPELSNDSDWIFSR